MSLSKETPKHISIIMDGNGRWAKKRMLPRFMGHKRGLNAVKKIVSYSAELGIESLTLFAFSTENWKRPKEEITQLMKLFLYSLQKEVKKLNDNNVKLHVIGDKSCFSEEIVRHIEIAENMTQNNSGLKLNIAANYGGRWDVIEAIKKWHKNNQNADISKLDEKTLSSYMSLSNQAEPELLIRTGGEQRISNFLIWQQAYTEFYFSDVLWPNFDKTELDNAINSFKQRERRFGKTSDQVKT